MGRTTWLFRPGQFRVIDPPEPTIGQLVDAMHQEIECVCREHGIRLPIIDLDIFGDEVSFVSVKWVDEWITGKLENPEYSKGPTPQAALRAMIERLREIGHDRTHD